jgi:23S rRNA (guanosine2251-2'-O)-methyltransferase
VNFGDLLERIQDRSETPFLLLVDSIQDPRNLGALIRTAICAGIQAVVIPKDRAAGPLPSVSKASAGALEHMVVTRVTNLASAMDAIRKAGIWIAGLDINASTTIFASDLTGPLALVVGGEEKGLRPLVKKKCDQTVVIPQTGAIDSLNASVAGAVVLYEALRQRNTGLS